MVQSISLDLLQKPMQTLKQMQRLIMSPQMQQAIHLMQMPIMELSNRIEEEIVQNPVLEESIEYSEKDEELKNLESALAESSDDGEMPLEREVTFDEKNFEILKKLDQEWSDHFEENGNYSTIRTAEEEKLKTFLEDSIHSPITLLDYLIGQARETFDNRLDLERASFLIGNFDEKGFLSVSLSEMATLCNCSEEQLFPILEKIQEFEPYGIGARNLQESLLIQLRHKQKKGTIAYRLISEQYDNLLHNQILQIQRAMKVSVKKITKAIEEDISKLDLNPAGWFSRYPIQPIIPDVTIHLEGEQLMVVVNDEQLPSLRLNKRYLSLLEDENVPQETKEFIKQKIISARWFLRNVDQRNETLKKIAQSLAEKQRSFFIDPTGQLVPLTMKSISEDLDLHESTIVRAVSNKYIDSPRGLLPLRSFFTNSYRTNKGEDISSKTVREELLDLISQEDKRKPLSDQAISKLLKVKGIECARRTVAKFRAACNMGNAHQRKKFS